MYIVRFAHYYFTLSNDKLSQRRNWISLKLYLKVLWRVSYQSSACFIGGGSNLRERAVKIWLNFSYLSVWLTCAPLLPHSNLIWNSVLKISLISSSGWKPSKNKTKKTYFSSAWNSVENRLKTCLFLK